VNRFGGYRIQGRGGQAATRTRAAARSVVKAGADMLVIEAVPEPLARAIAAESEALTIGIGASAACSGQVLVLHDMLGVATDRRPRFVKNFLLEGGSVQGAARAYLEQVQSGAFPGAEHVYADAN
jgi:3-methyl-2-oxobutanoate hydroxymethyltransferase